LVIGEDAVDEAHHHGDVAAAEDAGSLGEAELAGSGLVLGQEAAQLEQSLARHDHAPLEIEVPLEPTLHQAEPVPVGGHHPHVAFAALEKDAVQVCRVSSAEMANWVFSIISSSAVGSTGTKLTFSERGKGG